MLFKRSVTPNTRKRRFVEPEQNGTFPSSKISPPVDGATRVNCFGTEPIVPSRGFASRRVNAHQCLISSQSSSTVRRKPKFIYNRAPNEDIFIHEKQTITWFWLCLSTALVKRDIPKLVLPSVVCMGFPPRAQLNKERHFCTKFAFILHANAARRLPPLRNVRLTISP